MPRKKYTAAERHAYLLAYDTSGQSPIAFADGQKLKRTTFSTWLSRRNKNEVTMKAKKLSPKKRFVELSPRMESSISANKASPSPSKEHFRISLGHLVIECDGPPDPLWLATLAQVL